MRKLFFIFIVAIQALCSCGEKQTEKQILSYKKNTTATNKSAGTVFYDISLDEALEKAAKENKLVFIDCSTTTCAPCKMMRRSVFPKEAVGEYINSNFIPIHMNMDKDTGSEVAQIYEIDIYPTYLILNPDGSKRGKVIGADKNVSQFLNKIKQVTGV